MKLTLISRNMTEDKKKDKMSFTEVLLLVVIIGFLYLIMTPISSGPYPPKSKKFVARDHMTQIIWMIEEYAKDCKTFPADFKALTVDPGIESWRGPYSSKDIPADPWGTPYRYRIVDGKAVVDSAGPDRKFDTEDDIKGEE